MKSAIAVFAREPVPGTVKSRLARDIGDEAAAELYAAMLRDSLNVACKAARKLQECEVFLAYTPRYAFDAGPYSLASLWHGPRLCQSEGDLGQRLLDCFGQLQAHGMELMAIIGSDSPDLPPGYICRAFTLLSAKEMVSGQLRHNRLVVGPAQDGGFYLIAAAGPIPRALFEGVEWSTRNTLEQVMANADRLQLCIGRWDLGRWNDVDTMSDLENLVQRFSSDSPGTPTHAPQTARWLRSRNLLSRV